MGMGTGYCCCGDSPPPGYSSSDQSQSVSSRDYTFICGPCRAGCGGLTEDIKLPSIIYAEFSMLDGGDPWAAPYTYKGFPCDCETYHPSSPTNMLRTVGAFVLNNIDTSNFGSCTWSSDCYDEPRFSWKTDSASPCPFPFTFPQAYRKYCYEIPASSLSANPERFYVTMSVSSSACASRPFIQLTSTGGHIDGSGIRVANDCPPLYTRTGGGLTPSVYNETFSCSPFYYEADLWYPVSNSNCCIYDACEYFELPGSAPCPGQDCCQSVTSSQWEGYHVVLT